MLTDIEIDEYYKTQLPYFINPNDKMLDMSLNNKQSNIIVDVTDKRILGVAIYSGSVKALSSFDKQVVYSYVFDSMKSALEKGIQRYIFSRNKCWRMRVSDDGSTWEDSPNIATVEQLHSYIFFNQKVALLDVINGEIDQFRKLITKGTEAQQNIYFGKYLEAKYIIDNNIDVYDDSKDYKEHYNFFKYQPNIESYVCWYTTAELDFSGVPKREIDVTRKLIESLVQIVDDSKIDFRKLNSDYIVSTISDKIHKLMKVKEGTRLKAIDDYTNEYKQKYLTKDQYYEVRSSSMTDGYVTVLVNGDNNRTQWLKYSYFEDVQSHRDDLLSSLFGE